MRGNSKTEGKREGKNSPLGALEMNDLQARRDKEMMENRSELAIVVIVVVDVRVEKPRRDGDEKKDGEKE